MAESHTLAEISPEPWDQLGIIIDSGNAEHLEAFVLLLPPSDVAYTIGRLSEDAQQRLFSMLRPEFSAEVLEHLEDEFAADIVEELPADKAAAIVEELDSDDQADILKELDEEDAEAILDQMSPDEAEDARRLVEYEHFTAGGVMRAEYLAFTPSTTIATVIDNLRREAEEHDEYDPTYIYAVDDDGKLKGVVRLRHLVLAPPQRTLESIMLRDPQTVNVNADIDELEDIFERHAYRSMPVVDADDRMVGVVTSEALQEEIGERAEEEFMRFGGIISGEELRSMSLASRTTRRLVYLGPNLLLLLMSISIIAIYEDVIERVTALAVFLPVVVGLSGSAGNQAVAVSMRELSMGLARPGDVRIVFTKEIGVGLVNGLVLGLALALIVFATRGNVALSGVIGVAFFATHAFATVIGGTIPLLFRAINVDPAMAASPVMASLVDVFGFFIMLSFAQAAVSYLT